MRLFIIAVAMVIVGCGENTTRSNVSGIQMGDYKVVPYIREAVRLQSLGKEAAIKELFLESKKENCDDKVIILCRMLFVQRGNATFRRPEIGGASFLGDTIYADWPYEPIELVKGVPFLITHGYRLGGRAEPSWQYLKYCKDKCEWSKFRYIDMSQLEIEQALNILIYSPKWNRPLSTYEIEFLSNQIKNND